jgi:hypothetical protein
MKVRSSVNAPDTGPSQTATLLKSVNAGKRRGGRPTRGHLRTPGTLSACVATAAFVAFQGVVSPVSAEVIVRGIEGAPLSEIRPAPTFLKPDINIVTAQPSPSEINSSFLGPVLLMKQAQVDLEKGTAKLPLRKGRLRSGELVWFVLTDTTDENLANLHGLVYSPKLAYGLNGMGSREATIDRDGSFIFDGGKVDFSPDRGVSPGNAPDFFPPKVAHPGSVGDANYSPLVHIKNASKDVLFNAPMLAFNVGEEKLNEYCNGNADHKVLHDKVVAICPRDGFVTLALTIGFTFSKPILYLHCGRLGGLKMFRARFVPKRRPCPCGPWSPVAADAELHLFKNLHSLPLGAFGGRRLMAGGRPCTSSGRKPCRQSQLPSEEGVLWPGAGQVRSISLHVSTAKRSISSSKSRLVSKRLTAR